MKLNKLNDFASTKDAQAYGAAVVLRFEAAKEAGFGIAPVATASAPKLETAAA
jgi:hypothetical protein